MSTPAYTASHLPTDGRLAEDGKAFPEVHDRLHDAQQLMAVSERMLREGCGEQWLLQPMIPDMGCNEYRQACQAQQVLLLVDNLISMLIT